MYQYRTRYYHAQLGRFVNRDPIRYLGGMNLYGYVGGNPIRYFDPLGLWNTGHTITGIQWGPDVNMAPYKPKCRYRSDKIDCTGGIRSVEKTVKSKKWVTLASIEDTISGYYDGLLGDTAYVYQGTFTLQRAMNCRYDLAKCKYWGYRVHCPSSSVNTYTWEGGTFIDNCSCSWGETRVLFNGQIYEGEFTPDPSDVMDWIGIIQLGG